jgi:radical SAM protein with 4Fe4S-binding SPASM domain
MNESFVSAVDIDDFALWDKIRDKRFPASFDIEITARCNNACGHCYINLPADDPDARAKELTVAEISRIADKAVSMGTIWCLITGGEPLLRPDFADIYLSLKRKGLLVSVFTNAACIKPEHISLFKKYPPRDIEVTVYGVTKETYEVVTRIPGSFSAFMKGLTALTDNGIRVRLKAMAIRSNVHELPQISDFCRERTKDYFRFDPMLHLRFDRDEKRNEMIRAERLAPEEITAIEKADPKRFHALMDNCDKYIFRNIPARGSDRIFNCGIGQWSFTVGYNGFLRICPALWHPDCMYDLRKGPLEEAWEDFIPQVLGKKTQRREYIETCGRCPIINLCLWCPAHAYLETGKLDLPVESFCKVAHARAAALKENIPDRP